MAKNAKKKVVAPVKIIDGKCGSIQYKMPADFAKDLLKGRKGAEAKIDAQIYLCQYVDEQYGLLGHCTKVIFE